MKSTAATFRRPGYKILHNSMDANVSLFELKNLHSWNSEMTVLEFKKNQKYMLSNYDWE